MPKPKVSKRAPKTPQKPHQRPSLHPEAQDIILHTRCEVSRLAEQIRGIEEFTWNVDEGKQDLYDFSCAMSTVLDMIATHAQQVHKMLGVAGGYVAESELERMPWREKGGAQ